MPEISLMERLLRERLEYEDQQRLERYKAAWDAYYGRLPKPLKVKRDRPDDNVLLNYSRLVVDVGVAFLFGKDVPFELPKEVDGEGKASVQSPAEKWLADCWRANRKASTLQKWAKNGAVCGHSYLKIVEQPERPFPRLVVLDPANVKPDWSRDDIDDVWRYTITFQAQDRDGRVKLFRQRLTRRDDGAAWDIVDEVVVPPNKVWVEIGRGVWEWPFAPLVDCQNLPMPNEYFGMADLESDLIDLAKAINFVASNTQAIIRYHAHPRVWGKGFQGKIDVAVDGTLIIPNPQGTLQALEMHSDLASSRNFYRDLREAFHELAQVPEVATGKMDGVGALSGRALNILYGPLLVKTEQKHVTYGDALAELNGRLLALGGHGEGLQPQNVWPELLPGDPKEEAETLLVHQQLGVSKDTLVAKLGYDPEEEAEKRDVEAKAALELALSAYESGEGLGGRHPGNRRERPPRGEGGGQ